MKGDRHAHTVEVESTLTGRYQTTVLESVRRALRLCKRDKIHCAISPSDEVVLTRVEASEGADLMLEPADRGSSAEGTGWIREEARQQAARSDHKQWFRAKFVQQYQLFFRYHLPSKVKGSNARLHSGTSASRPPLECDDAGLSLLNP